MDSPRKFTKVETKVTEDETPALRDDVPRKLSPHPDQQKPSEPFHSKPVDAPGDLVPR